MFLCRHKLCKSILFVLSFFFLDFRLAKSHKNCNDVEKNFFPMFDYKKKTLRNRRDRDKLAFQIQIFLFLFFCMRLVVFFYIFTHKYPLYQEECIQLIYFIFFKGQTNKLRVVEKNK